MSLALRFSLGQPVTVGYNASGSVVNLANSGVVAAEDAAYGQVGYFDGNAKLELGSIILPPAAFGAETRCFSLWVNPTSASTTLFSTGDEATSGGLLRVSLNSSRQVRVEYSTLPDSIAATSLPLGAWSHVILSYDGSRVQCYVGGVLRFDDPRDLRTSVADLSIGDAFHGHISDFRLYNNSLPVQDVTDLYEGGPNELFNLDTTSLVVFQEEGIQSEVVVNDGVVAVGDVTTKTLTLVAEKAASGETELVSSVYAHDLSTSERLCISETLHTVDEDETECVSCLKLSNTDSSDARIMQSCVQYGGESVDIHCVSAAGEDTTSTVNFDGLSFDSDEAAVVLGPFSEFRIKYDDTTDTLQIQHLDGGVYTTKVEYGR